MAFIYCKKCGEYSYLTPHAFWNVNDLNVKCKDCSTINTITTTCIVIIFIDVPVTMIK